MSHVLIMRHRNQMDATDRPTPRQRCVSFSDDVTHDSNEWDGATSSNNTPPNYHKYIYPYKCWHLKRLILARFAQRVVIGLQAVGAGPTPTPTRDWCDQQPKEEHGPLQLGFCLTLPMAICTKTKHIRMDTTVYCYSRDCAFQRYLWKLLAAASIDSYVILLDS